MLFSFCLTFSAILAPPCSTQQYHKDFTSQDIFLQHSHKSFVLVLIRYFVSVPYSIKQMAHSLKFRQTQCNLFSYIVNTIVIPILCLSRSIFDTYILIDTKFHQAHKRTQRQMFSVTNYLRFRFELANIQRMKDFYTAQ